MQSFGRSLAYERVEGSYCAGVRSGFARDSRLYFRYSAGAKSLTDRILRAVQSLSDLPLRFPLYEKEPWRGRGLRKMQVGNYLVFYLTDEKTTTVMALHVLYAGRDIARCLDEAKE